MNRAAIDVEKFYNTKKLNSSFEWRNAKCGGIIFFRILDMSSISFKNFKIDIEVRNIDGVFQQVFGLPFPKGFWVLLTIQSESGEKETFPRVDENYKVKTFFTYEEAIDDIAQFLKSHFK